MMRFVTATVSVAILFGVCSGPAEARPDTRRMTCAEARALVARAGAIVMTTGPHLYMRFVTGPRFCDRWETTRPAYAPTLDNPRCFVGRRCAERLLFRID